jgi:hypothetical protein
MAFFDRAFDDLTEGDIEGLVIAQAIEDSTIEFKREVEIDSAGASEGRLPQ